MYNNLYVFIHFFFQGNLPDSLKDKLESIKPDGNEETCDLGEFVNVLGSLKTFRNVVEISVERLGKVSQKLLIILHCLMGLY